MDHERVEQGPSPRTFTGQSEWSLRARRAGGPLRTLLRSETASAVVLVVAIAVAVAWASWTPAGYRAAWSTTLAVSLGRSGLHMDLRSWVNSGLMTFFFLVVGLEARREYDLGELRDRKRLAMPAAVGVAGASVPVLLFLAIAHGQVSGRAWGVAMSTDSALALGFLALLGSKVSDRTRAFVLTVSVVDDVVALTVIATVYSRRISWAALLTAVALLGAMVLVRRLGLRQPLVFGALCLATWVATNRSGVDPVVLGLVIGLSSSAYAPTRRALERLTDLFHSFREQPTPDLARSTAMGLRAALSPNARARQVFLPATLFVVVPLFAVANAGVPLGEQAVRDALTSTVTVALVVAYAVGKPAALLIATGLVRTVSGGRVRPPVGWAGLVGSGTVNASAFTVSILVADRVFTGPEHAAALVQVKVGVLLASLAAATATLLVFTATAAFGSRGRGRASSGSAPLVEDLDVPVDPDHDHLRGRQDASVTLVEYGDFACGYCGLAEQVARAALAEDDDLRFVWRHLPLDDVHPTARLAAEASEAAHAQGRFWPMHDLLLTHQDRLSVEDLVGYARRLGLDEDRFRADLASGVSAARVDRDVESADLSNVSGTPTFFINGQRHYGAYDQATLRDAVMAARQRTLPRGG